MIFSMKYSYRSGLASGYALGLISFGLLIAIADEFIDLEILIDFFRNPAGISLTELANF